MSGVNPVVSVIMPVYNAEKFVKKTIESILNQTFSNYKHTGGPLYRIKSDFPFSRLIRMVKRLISKKK
jgi:glycosyltransferase involved in cell wall biosynthesis